MGTLVGAALGLFIATHTAAVIMYAPSSVPLDLRARVRAAVAVMLLLTGAVSVYQRTGSAAVLAGVAVLATLGTLYPLNRRVFMICAALGYIAGGALVMASVPAPWDAGSAVVAVLLGAVLGVLCLLSAGLLFRNAVREAAVLLVRRAQERHVLDVVLAGGALGLCFIVFHTNRPLYATLGSALVIGVVLSLTRTEVGSLRLSVWRCVALLVAVSSLGATVSSNGSAEAQAGTTIGTASPTTTVAASSNEQKLAACAAVPQSRYLEQRDCYSEYFIERGEAVGTDAALEELIAVHKNATEGPKFRPHCHEVLHDFAKDRASKEGVDALLGSYVITCTGGFAHGILVAYTAQVGWPSIKAELPTFCATLTQKVVDAMVAKGKPKPTETGWLKWNCDHMLGHLVYENTRDDMNAGAQLCSSWALKSSELDSCGAGFFMEHFLDITRNLNGWTAPKQDSDVFKTCNTIDGPIREWCYSESGVSASMFTSYDYPRAAGLCDTFVPDEYQKVCYGSIGRILVVTNGYSPEKSIAACVSLAVVEPQAQDSCLEEVAGSMLSETFAADAAKQACDAVLDAKNKATCDERRIALEKQMSGSGLGGGTGRVES